MLAIVCKQVVLGLDEMSALKPMKKAHKSNSSVWCGAKPMYCLDWLLSSNTIKLLNNLPPFWRDLKWVVEVPFNGNVFPVHQQCRHVFHCSPRQLGSLLSLARQQRQQMNQYEERCDSFVLWNNAFLYNSKNLSRLRCHAFQHRLYSKSKANKSTTNSSNRV